MIRVDGSEWAGLEGLGVETLRELRPRAQDLMRDGGTRFVAELKLKLSGSRSGRTYKVSATGKPHQASAPGEAPAVLFGALRNSMGHSRPKWEGWTLNMEVGSGLGARQSGQDPNAYARRLEYGGFSYHPWPVYIAPRPYLEPTAEKMDPLLQALFQAGI